jgi:formyltetrahydrofolate-dependent phosphoribosylglycinamide formyltransferase
VASKLKVGVLISGRGSNMQALLAACAAPDFPAEIVTVIANRPGAGGLALAQGAGVDAKSIDHKAFAGREPFEAALTEALEQAGVELLCLAGFMRVVTPGFVRHWQGRMINIHPSLLPLFPGLDTHARALAAGAKLHGCTVHLVTQGMDEGPILAQAAVPVLPGDTEGTLAERVLRQEHGLYPAALAAFVAGTPGGPPDPVAALSNPLPWRRHVP